MKTLKELREHNIDFLVGYCTALNDFVNLIMDPEIYDPRHSRVLLNYIDEYVSERLNEEKEYINKLVEEERDEINATYR